jgi:hypothetical protein
MIVFLVLRVRTRRHWAQHHRQFVESRLLEHGLVRDQVHQRLVQQENSQTKLVQPMLLHVRHVPVERGRYLDRAHVPLVLPVRIRTHSGPRHHLRVLLARQEAFHLLVQLIARFVM